MAEKIKIAELDLDVRSMIQKLYETADSIKYMKEQQRLLTEESKKYNQDSKAGREQLEKIGLQYQKNAVQIKQLGGEYTTLSKAVQAQVKANGDLITKEQAVDLALKAEITSIASARQNNKELLAIRNQLNPAIEKEAEQIKALNKRYDENTAYIRENASEREKQKMDIGDYKNQIVEAANELNIFNGGLTGFITRAQAAGGAGPLVATSFATMKAGLIGLTKAALAFIATPLGATITALVGIVAATREWIKYNQEVAKQNRIVAASTKQVGDELNATRVKVTSLAKSFDVEQKKVLDAAKSYVTQYGVTWDEALDKVQEGLIKSQGNNEQFLDSVKEYPKVIANAGFSINEFQSLVNTGIDVDMYEKLPDAVKEFYLSVTEQSPAAREALENAFGEGFTKKLFDNIEDGSITVKEALLQISQEADRLGLNVQQNQKLTADLFRGAGEDAGGALKIFEAVTKSIQDQKRPLNEVEQSVKDLTDSELALAEAQDLALNSKGFEIWKNKALIMLNDVAQAFYDTVAVITNSSEELEAMAQNSSEAKAIRRNTEDGLKEFERFVDNLKKKVGDGFNLEQATSFYINNLKTSLERARQEKDEFEVKMLQGEIEAIEKAGKQKLDIINKYGLEEQKASEERRQKALDDYAEKIRLELQLLEQSQGVKFKSMQEEIKLAKDVRDKSIEAAKAEYNASKQTANDKLKLQIAENDAKLKFLEAQAQAVDANAEREFQRILAKNKSILDSNKFLSDELFNQEIARMDRVAQAEKDRLAIKLETEKKSAEEIAMALQAIDDENYKKKEDLAEQRKQAEQSKQLIDIENKRAADQLTFEEDMELEREKLNIQRQQEIDAAEGNGAAIALINEKYDNKERELEKKKLEYKIGLASQSFSMMADILGRQSKVGKALAAASALIDTYQAANKALAASPPPFNYVAAAAVTATGLRNVAQIKGTQNPKFEQGGLVSIGGNRHSAGGTLFTGEDGTHFEAEQGELIGVMNRNAARHFMAFNNAFPAGGTSAPNYFANGGIVSREISPRELDVDYLAGRMAEAYQALPSPVVAVQDIITEGNKTVTVKQAASF